MEDNTALEPAPATFTLLGYRVLNIGYDGNAMTTGEFSVKIEPFGDYQEAEGHFDLTLEVEVFAKQSISDNEQPLPIFFIALKGNFVLAPGTTLSSFPDYLYPNSVAILYPYVRSMVSMITVLANGGAILMPVLNLYAVGERLKQKMTQMG